jgi:hypothetical protein
VAIAKRLHAPPKDPEIVSGTAAALAGSCLARSREHRLAVLLPRSAVGPTPSCATKVSGVFTSCQEEKCVRQIYFLVVFRQYYRSTAVRGTSSSPQGTRKNLGPPAQTAAGLEKGRRLRQKVLPSFTSAMPLRTLSGVNRLSRPSWSSEPQFAPGRSRRAPLPARVLRHQSTFTSFCRLRNPGGNGWPL